MDIEEVVPELPDETTIYKIGGVVLFACCFMFVVVGITLYLINTNNPDIDERYKDELRQLNQQKMAELSSKIASPINILESKTKSPTPLDQGPQITSPPSSFMVSREFKKRLKGFRPIYNYDRYVKIVDWIIEDIGDYLLIYNVNSNYIEFKLSSRGVIELRKSMTECVVNTFEDTAKMRVQSCIESPNSVFTKPNLPPDRLTIQVGRYKIMATDKFFLIVNTENKTVPFCLGSANVSPDKEKQHLDMTFRTSATDCWVYNTSTNAFVKQTKCDPITDTDPDTGLPDELTAEELYSPSPTLNILANSEVLQVGNWVFENRATSAVFGIRRIGSKSLYDFSFTNSNPIRYNFYRQTLCTQLNLVSNGGRVLEWYPKGCPSSF